jgi:hypothetical protein
MKTEHKKALKTLVFAQSFVEALDDFGGSTALNYEPQERTELPTESEPEILFWCDCGAKYDWRIKPMKKLN